MIDARKLIFAASAAALALSAGNAHAQRGADNPPGDVRQARGADDRAGHDAADRDRVANRADNDVNDRRGRGADNPAGDVRQARGADNPPGDVRQGRGADNPPGDVRMGHGADDPRPHH